MLNIIRNNNVKDYEVLKQSQPSNNSQNNEDESQKQEISLINVIVFIVSIFLLIVFTSFVYKYYKFKSFPQSQDNSQIFGSSQSQSNQYNESQQANEEESKTEEIKFYEMENKDDINIEKYAKYLPFINNAKDNITNLTSIFESKRLFIKDVNITKDYIEFIRKNDDEFDQRNNENIFYEPYDPNYIPPQEDKLSLKEFYKLCDQKDIDFVNITEDIEFPFLSIIIPIYNKNLNIVKTLRSIQYQTYTDLEIIIVDDVNTNHKELYNSFFQKEPRLRIFTQLKNQGIWKKRLDGYLYSRGKFILHMNPGDILSDNYIIDDVCNMTLKYRLSSLRFSYSRTNYDKKFLSNQTFAGKKIYNREYVQLLFGSSDYNIYEKGFGYIWNIIVRSNIYTSGLEIADEYVLNAYNDIWESMMWNDLINKISLSNLVINRLGYINLYNSSTEIHPKIKTQYDKNKTIRELIHFWLLDYFLLKKEEMKKDIIIETLRNFTDIKNIYCNLKINLNDLNPKFKVYEHLLTLLMNDNEISEDDKKFVETLYNKYINMKEIKIKEKVESKILTDKSLIQGNKTKIDYKNKKTEKEKTK